YTAYGEPSVQSNGNGTTTTYHYDSRHKPTTITTASAPAGTLQDLGFTRDAEDKITAIASPFANESWSPIAYDEIDRLTSATNATSSRYNQNLAYDAVGNMLSNSAVGAYSSPAQGAGSVRPHATTRVGATPYSYDANGSITGRGASTLSWDGEN